MQYEIEMNERAAVMALPLSDKTTKLAGELAKLAEERETVSPQIQRIMAKIDAMTTDEAVAKLTPLELKRSVVSAKMLKARQAVMAGIVADSAAWQNDSERAVDVARLNHADTKAQFAEKIKAAFNTKDSERLMKGQSAAQSSEVQDAFNAYRKANEQAALAGVARRCLDRQRSVELVEAGLAVSTGRPHVMEAEWYARNMAIRVPELMD